MQRLGLGHAECDHQGLGSRQSHRDCLVFLKLLFHFALGALVTAPIILRIFLEAITPGLPALRGKLVNDIALFVKDVGRFAK